MVNSAFDAPLVVKEPFIKFIAVSAFISALSVVLICLKELL